MDITDSFPMTGFGSSEVETSGFATIVLISYETEKTLLNRLTVIRHK